VAALRNRGIDPKGKRIHLIGAGGVARAMALALAQAGVASITMRDIDNRRARNLSDTVNAAFPAVRARAVEDDEYQSDIIANATPLGMRDHDPPPCDPSRIAPSTVVTDVIPKPDITPFLAAAVHDAQNQYTLACNAIENDISTYREATQFGTQVFPPTTKMGMGRKKSERFGDPINHPVGRLELPLSLAK
jgi:shikimate 5-dehydrogenase